MEAVKALKCVEIPCNPPEEVIELLSVFRSMVNYCVHVGLERGVSSSRLTREVYHRLMEYDHSWYVLSAVEVATAILKNHRKAKRRNPNVKVPRGRKLVAKTGKQAIKIVDGRLRNTLKA